MITTHPAYPLDKCVQMFNDRFGRQLDASELDWMQIDNMSTYAKSEGEWPLAYFLARHAENMKGKL